MSGLEVEIVLAVDCRTLLVALKKFLITYLQAGTGMFTKRRIGMGDVFGYYYGLLVNDNMTRSQDKTQKYGEELMQMTWETFVSWQTEF